MYEYWSWSHTGHLNLCQSQEHWVCSCVGDLLSLLSAGEYSSWKNENIFTYLWWTSLNVAIAIPIQITSVFQCLNIFCQLIALQTHPTSFPGQTPTDCPRDYSKVHTLVHKIRKKYHHMIKRAGQCPEDEMLKRRPPWHPRPLQAGRSDPSPSSS